MKPMESGIMWVYLMENHHIQLFNGKTRYNLPFSGDLWRFMVINVGIAMSLAPPLFLRVGFHHP